jgi:hypothetical protein
MDTVVKIILPSSIAGSIKGSVFEDLMVTVFRAQGYELDKNINFTGLEVDIIGKHIDRNETLYVECKAKVKPRSSEIRNFVFNVRHKNADYGYFVYTEKLDHQAEGLRREIEEDKNKYPNITFFGPDKIIRTLENVNLIKPLIPSIDRHLLKKILCYSYFGIYYILITSDMPGNLEAYIYDKDGNRLNNIDLDSINNKGRKLNLKQAIIKGMPELEKVNFRFEIGEKAKVSDWSRVINIEVGKYKRQVSLELSKYFERKVKETGSKFIIYGRDLDNDNENTLEFQFNLWLTDENSIFVLLGEAGSGKSFSLKELHKNISENAIGKYKNTLSVYIDLAKYSTIDDFFELITIGFRQYGLELDEYRFNAIQSEWRIVIILDSFDEYDRGGFSGISSRLYDNFDIFSKLNCKVIFGCRNHYFRSLSVVRKYSSSGTDMEIISDNALIYKIKDLDFDQVNSNLLSFNDKIANINRLFEFVKTPLAFTMLHRIITSKRNSVTIDLNNRWELYNQYLDGLFAWDKKSKEQKFSSSFQEKFYLLFAEYILLTGEAAISYETVTKIIKQIRRTRNYEDIDESAMFFRKSSILEVDPSGRMIFRHKTFREFLVAKAIYNDIETDNRDFKFRWFTRDERSFIAERLRLIDIETLLSWAADKDHFIAQNYACFILGSKSCIAYYDQLKRIFDENDDLLLRINVANALAQSREKWVMDYLIRVIEGYCFDIGNQADADKMQVDLVAKTSNHIYLKYNKNVMRIHISEAIEALGNFNHVKIKELIEYLANEDPSIVGDEARTIIKSYNCNIEN